MWIYRLKVLGILSAAVALSFLPSPARAQAPDQSVTIFQYRQVPADNVSEFLFRETTYWSKVARKAVDDGKMTFWALLERVSSDALKKAPNYLFINTFPNVDAVGDVFNAAPVFPDVPLTSMDTNALSTTTDVFFLHNESQVYAASAVPADEFHYVIINYHNSSDQAAFIALEKQYWMPFIEKAMNQGQTTQRGWANARLLAPRGDAVGFNSVSFDLYPSLQKALMPAWSADVVFPQEGLDKLNALRLNNIASTVYRIVAVVSAP